MYQQPKRSKPMVTRCVCRKGEESRRSSRRRQFVYTLRAPCAIIYFTAIGERKAVERRYTSKRITRIREGEFLVFFFNAFFKFIFDINENV